MLRFNPDVVASFIGEIRKAVNRLKTLSQLPRQDFLRNPDKIDSTKYNLIIAIEAAVDLCNHLISYNGFRVPQSYADTFEVLKEEGLFDEDLVLRLKAMARLRNRLTHLYWDVDNETIYKILQDNLEDFALFLQHIGRSLRLGKETPGF